jgi:hypothetical protein
MVLSITIGSDAPILRRKVASFHVQPGLAGVRGAVHVAVTCRYRGRPGGATAPAFNHFDLEFRSRDTISLKVNLSAPPVTPIPTPVSIFTILPG